MTASTLYRIEFDFALGTRPRFLDVYGQLVDLPLVGNLRIGHFFEPFSLQRLTSNRYQTFMERPLLDSFAPARNLGVAAFDEYADRHGCWQVGGFAAESNFAGEQQSDRGGDALTGRITYLPYWDEPSDGRYFMHLGACYSFRQASERPVAFGNWPGFRPGSTETLNWPLWVTTGPIAVDNFQLFDVEWAWVMGAWFVQAEYCANQVNQIANPNVVFQSWYVESGYFLTGESRPYLREFGIFNRVTPYEPFFRVRTKDGIKQGLGAWEIAFRVDYLNLNDRNIQGGRLIDLSFGLNWYLNPYTRIYFNYVHADLARGAPGLTQGNLYGLRAQFEF